MRVRGDWRTGFWVWELAVGLAVALAFYVRVCWVPVLKGMEKGLLGAK